VLVHILQLKGVSISRERFALGLCSLQGKLDAKKLGDKAAIRCSYTSIERWRNIAIVCWSEGASFSEGKIAVAI